MDSEEQKTLRVAWAILCKPVPGCAMLGHLWATTRVGFLTRRPGQPLHRCEAALSRSSAIQALSLRVQGPRRRTEASGPR